MYVFVFIQNICQANAVTSIWILVKSRLLPCGRRLTWARKWQEGCMVSLGLLFRFKDVRVVIVLHKIYFKISIAIIKEFTFLFICFFFVRPWRVVRVVGIESFSPYRCGFKSRHGLSCEEVIQLGYRTSVVLLSCPLVPEIMQGGVPPMKRRSSRVWLRTQQSSVQLCLVNHEWQTKFSTICRFFMYTNELLLEARKITNIINESK